MTQAQAVVKYDLPRDVMCKIIKMAKVEPIGTVPDHVWKDYAEKDIVNAILLYYRNRYLKEVRRAERWKEKAHEIKAIYRKSNVKEDEDW